MAYAKAFGEQKFETLNSIKNCLKEMNHAAQSMGAVHGLS